MRGFALTLLVVSIFGLTAQQLSSQTVRPVIPPPSTKAGRKTFQTGDAGAGRQISASTQSRSEAKEAAA
jgi:hypothetical protein